MRFTGREQGVRGAQTSAERRPNRMPHGNGRKRRQRRKKPSGAGPVGYIEGAPPPIPDHFMVIMAAMRTPDAPGGGQTAPLSVSYGKTLAEVSEVVRSWIDYHGVGSTSFMAVPESGKVFDDQGKEVARVSYNGRVWRPGPPGGGGEEITGDLLNVRPAEFRRANPCGRRSNPGLAILNPLPDHLQAFARDQQLTPAELEEFNQAIARYCEFHGVEPEAITLEQIGETDGEGVKFLVGMGATEDVSYSANHKNAYQKSNKRGTPFRHEFPSKPHMATTPDGEMIVIVNRPGSGKRFAVSDWIRG